MAACQILRPSVVINFAKPSPTAVAQRRGAGAGSGLARSGVSGVGSLDDFGTVMRSSISPTRRWAWTAVSPSAIEVEFDAQPEHCPRVAWNVSLDHDLSDHTPVLGAVGGRTVLRSSHEVEPTSGSGQDLGPHVPTFSKASTTRSRNLPNTSPAGAAAAVIGHLTEMIALLF